MRIQHNITAMNSYRNYSANTKAVSKNLEKLSSGYRINRAGDDAAGLAISEKMRAQVTGLKTAQKNAKDGISLVQTAEGALTEVHSMLNRMVELADQSANGTYDDTTDRGNLQKEFNALRSEIDRISKATNFNGISLLDGSVNLAKGIEADTNFQALAAQMSGTLGTEGTEVDGVLTKGTATVDYAAKFYVGDITNNNVAAKNIVFNYQDNAGGSKAVTLTVAAGASVTTQNIADALNTLSNTGVSGDITLGDTGTAFDGLGKAGAFKDLYDVTVDGNMLTIKAKAHGTSTDPDEVINGANLKMAAANTITSTFDAADVTASIDKLKEKYSGAGNAASIGYGTAAGAATEYKPAVAGSYQVASSKLTLANGATGQTMHNQGITVGDITYIIKSGTADLKGVNTNDPKVKVVNVNDGDNITQVGDKLAAAISADEGGAVAGAGSNGGYVATNNAGTLTISESTNRAQKVLSEAAGYTAGKGANMVKQESFQIAAASGTVNGTMKIDAMNMSNGTTVSVGGKTFMLTNDPGQTGSNGEIQVLYNKGASSDDIATALATAMTAQGINGVTANNDTLTFANTTSATGASTLGAGLRLQIGDTSDSYNQISVQVGKMDCTTLGIDSSKINIDKQQNAADAVKVLKDSINSVSSTRGDLGAVQNRLEHTINNLSVMTENIQDAESSIRDVDVADEMMNYTKNNILVQSAQAMLAQANQLPQGVLQLLG